MAVCTQNYNKINIDNTFFQCLFTLHNTGHARIGEARTLLKYLFKRLMVQTIILHKLDLLKIRRDLFTCMQLPLLHA